MPLNTSSILGSLRAQQFQSNQIVDQLVGFKREQTVNPLQDQKKSINSEIDHVNEVTKKMSSLLDAVSNITSNVSGYNGGGMGGLEAVGYNQSILNASANPSASLGNYSATVNQIAQSQMVESNLFNTESGGSISAFSTNTSALTASAGPGAVPGTHDVSVDSLFQREIEKSQQQFGREPVGMQILGNTNSSVANAVASASSTAGQYDLNVSSGGVEATGYNDALLDATATPSASPGSYGVDINQLAEAQILESNLLGSASGGSLSAVSDTPSVLGATAGAGATPGTHNISVDSLYQREILRSAQSFAQDPVGMQILGNTDTGVATAVASNSATAGEYTLDVATSALQATGYDDSIIDATATASATAGDYPINVNQLAQSQILRNDDLYGSDTGGSLTATSNFGGVSSATAGPNAIAGTKNVTVNSLYQQEINKSNVFGSATAGMGILSNSDNTVADATASASSVAGEYTLNATSSTGTNDIWQSDVFATADGSGIGADPTDSSIANATASQSATTGDYEVTIDQVAKRDIHSSQDLGSPTSAVAEGDLTIEVDTASGSPIAKTLSISAGETIQSVATKINNDGDIGDKVTAQVDPNGQMMISRSKKGHTQGGPAGAAMDMEYSPSGGGGGTALTMSEEQASQNADFGITEAWSGTTVASAIQRTNTVNVNGATFHLRGSGTTNVTIDNSGATLKQDQNIRIQTLDNSTHGAGANITLSSGMSLEDIKSEIDGSGVGGEVSTEIVSADDGYRLQVEANDTGAGEDLVFGPKVNATQTKLGMNEIQDSSDSGGGGNYDYTLEDSDGNEVKTGTTSDTFTALGTEYSIASAGTTTIEVGGEPNSVQKGELAVGYETDAGGNNLTNINIAEGDSLTDVKDKINNDSAINSYITASIVDEGGGKKLKLEHANKGDGNEITGLTFSSDGSNGQALNFGTTEQESTDGSITVDGTTTTAESNSITYNDVTYDLASTTSGTVDVQEGSSVGAGTLDIDVDGSNADSLTINHGASLNDVASQINNSSASSSIEASIVSAGPSDNKHKLEVKRTDSGTSNSVSLSHTLDADATGDKLTFSNFQSAQDATGTIDGTSFSSANNQVSQNGVDYQLETIGSTTVSVEGGGYSYTLKNSGGTTVKSGTTANTFTAQGTEYTISGAGSTTIDVGANPNSVAAGSIDFTFGANGTGPETATIDVSAGDSLADVKNKINNDSTMSPHVNASLVNTGGANPMELKLEHASKGAENTITANHNVDAGANGKALSFNQQQAASDAQISSSGPGGTWTETGQSNTLTHDSVTYDLQSTGSSTVTIDEASSVGAGTVDITVGQNSGGDQNFSINTKHGDSLNDVTSAINSSGASSYINASVVEDTASGKYQIEIERTDTGADATVSLNHSLDPDTTGEQLTFTQQQAAQDATGTIDGTSFSSANNQVSQNGVDYQLESTGSTTVDVSNTNYNYTLKDGAGDTVKSGSTANSFTALGTDYSIDGTGSTTIDVGANPNSVASGSLDLTYGTDGGGSQTTSINVAAGDSIKDVKEKINNNSTISPHINASINDLGGSPPLQLQLEQANKGAENTIDVTHNVDSGANGKALSFNETQTASDAQITSSGPGSSWSKTGDSNTLTRNGVTYNLQDTGSATVNIEEDASVAAGTLDLTVGQNSGPDQTFSINTQHGDSLNDVKQSINTAAGSYVDASVVEDTSTGKYKIQVEHTETGAGSTVSLSHSVAPDTTGNQLSFSQLQGAQNATGTIDGTSFNSTDNQLSQDGIDFEFQSTGSTSVSVENAVSGDVDDNEAFRKDLEEFVDKYNTAIDKLDEESDLVRGAKWRAKRAMQNVVAERVSGMTGEYGNLSSIGIETNYQSGKLSINEPKLSEALNNASDKVGALFAKENHGVEDSLKSVINNYIGPGNSIFDSKKDSLHNQKQYVTNEITEAQEDVSNYQEEIADKFQQLKTMRFQMRRSFSSLLG